MDQDRHQSSIHPQLRSLLNLGTRAILEEGGELVDDNAGDEAEENE